MVPTNLVPGVEGDVIALVSLEEVVRGHLVTANQQTLKKNGLTILREKSSLSGEFKNLTLLKFSPWLNPPTP